MSRHSRSLLLVFGVPLIIFVVGLAGLILALLVDDGVESVAALAVGIPVAIFVWVYLRRL